MIRCPVPETQELKAWAYSKAERVLAMTDRGPHRPYWTARLKLRMLAAQALTKAEKCSR